MILQALTEYYQRVAADGSSSVALEGFQSQEIPFVIILNSTGEFVGLQDTREGEGKKKVARSFIVPRAVKKTSGIAANLLWDNPAYVLARPKVDPNTENNAIREKAKKQQKCFINRILDSFSDSQPDQGISAVLQFLETGDYETVTSRPEWAEIEERGLNLSFQLKGDANLVCQRPAVVDAITRQTMSDAGGEQAVCIVTGKDDSIARLHTAIKGVWDAQTSGANIVSFNRPAFNSYGKDQGLNAPVGKTAEFAYTTALNILLAKQSRQRIQVGDASTVFWAQRSHPMEEIFADLFSYQAPSNSTQEGAQVSALYSAPTVGAPVLIDDPTRFYVLGLAPNAARIAVRFWHEGTVGETAEHLRRHFDDCAIVHGPNQPAHLSLFRLLATTALQGDSKNIQPNLAGPTMMSILGGTPYPRTLLASAVRRARAERDIPYPRVALIKAVLTRNARFYKQKEKEVGMSLDTTNVNPGYCLGRLFAVLERAQEFASPGLNATIRDRFYGAASSTPVAVFPHLMKLKNHHIAKLDNKGLAVNLEKEIGRIFDSFGNDFPTHLSLPDQGRFAIGYYHQRQAFFKKSETPTSQENDN